MNAQASGFSSRRRHPRYQVKSGDVIHSLYTCIDISETGMKFESSTEVRKAKVFNIIFNNYDEAIELECSIVWCRKAASVFNTNYSFGARFINHSITSQLAIRKFIDRRLGL